MKCRIAGLKVLINILERENRLIAQTAQYREDFSGNPDIVIGFPYSFLERRVEENPSVPLSEMEYVWTGYEFCRRLLEFGGFVLHASAVAYKGKAYLFSAPSGTGKSTHTSLWEKCFGEEAFIINDDKPAIILENEKIVVCGTPWSGKTDKNKNVSVPLGGICFIERGKENSIEKVNLSSAAAMILGQTLRYPSVEFMSALLDFLNKNLRNIPVFKMKCNISLEAAKMSYEFINKNTEGESFYEN